MKVFIASLGIAITWKKLPSEKIPYYTCINNLEEEVLDLVSTVQFDKNGDTTGHLGLVMTAVDFALVPGVMNSPFVRSAHPGSVNYNNPTLCNTKKQHTEIRLATVHRLHVFEMKQMMDTQRKKTSDVVL